MRRIVAPSLRVPPQYRSPSSGRTTRKTRRREGPIWDPSGPARRTAPDQRCADRCGYPHPASRQRRQPTCAVTVPPLCKSLIALEQARLFGRRFPIEHESSGLLQAFDDARDGVDVQVGTLDFQWAQGATCAEHLAAGVLHPVRGFDRAARLHALKALQQLTSFNLADRPATKPRNTSACIRRSVVSAWSLLTLMRCTVASHSSATYSKVPGPGNPASARAFASRCRLIAMLFALLTALGSVPAATSASASASRRRRRVGQRHRRTRGQAQTVGLCREGMARPPPPRPARLNLKHRHR